MGDQLAAVRRDFAQKCPHRSATQIHVERCVSWGVRAELGQVRHIRTIPLGRQSDRDCVSPKAGAQLVQTSGQKLKLVYPQAEAKPEDFEHLHFQYLYSCSPWPAQTALTWPKAFDFIQQSMIEHFDVR
jgi:hypothetical protein